MNLFYIPLFLKQEEREGGCLWKFIRVKKVFFKEKKEVQNALEESINDLYQRIMSYGNTDFNRIFNDDKIKYDKHGEFYTYKAQKNNMQLRLLYSFFYNEDGIPTFLLADYYIKKKNNKVYIKAFEWSDDVAVSYLWDLAKPIRV